MAVKKAEVIYIGDAASLIRASRQASGAVGGSAKGIESAHVRIRKSFAGMSLSAVKAGGAVAGAYLSIQGAKSAIDTTSELADTTLKLHRVLGLSVQQASAWGAVAKARGIDTKQLAMAFGTLSKNVAAAKAGSDKQRTALMGLGTTQKDLIKKSALLAKGAGAQSDAFKKLGLTQADLNAGSHDFQGLLDKLQKGFERMPAGTDKAALGMKLFGRGWQTILPLMRQGNEGMDAQLKLATEMGATFHGKTVKSLEEFKLAQEKGKYATMGLQLAFGEYLAPALTKGITAITKFVEGIRNGTGAGGKFADKMKELWGKLQPVLNALKDIAGFLVHQPRLLELAAAAFVVWKTAAAAASLQAKAKLIATFLGMGPKARVGGAIAGTEFGGAASTAATGELKAMKWGGLGKFAGYAFAAGFVYAALPTIDKLTGGGLSGNDVQTPVKRGLFNLKNDPHGIDGPGRGTRFPKLTSSPRGGFAPAKGADYSKGSEPVLADRLNRLGRKLGLHLTGLSGYRSPSHSVAVGGFPNDPHTRGQASDTPGVEKVPESVLRQFGLTRPFGGAKEADHIQLLPGYHPSANTGGMGSSKYRLTPNQIRGIAHAAGFRGSALTTAVAIAEAESGGRPGATNRNRDGSIDRGLFQINSVHGKASTFNLAGNAAEAFKLFKARGGFGDWTTFLSGAYKKFLGNTGHGAGAMVFDNRGANPVKQALAALNQFEKAAAKAKKAAQLKITVANIDKLKAFRDAVAGIKKQVHDLAGQAARAWRAIQEKGINATHDAAIAAINGSADAQELAGLQAQDRAADDAKTTAQLNQDLADAIASGDKKAQKDAEDAIQAYARQKREDELNDNIANAKQKADDAQQTALDGLDQQTADYEAGLDAQFDVLTAQLEKRKTTYAEWAKAVNAILAGYGLSVATSSSDQSSIQSVGGPNPGVFGQGFLGGAGGAGYGFGGHRASGGSVRAGMTYTVGEVGPERFTPAVNGRIDSASRSRGSNGPLVVVEQMNVRSSREVVLAAERLAHKIAYG